jgi:hypothetical protein
MKHCDRRARKIGYPSEIQSRLPGKSYLSSRRLRFFKIVRRR